MNRCATQSQVQRRIFPQPLGKFIHDPVVLSSLDQDYFGKFARDMGSSRRDQHDREVVAAQMSMTACDLEGAVRWGREKLFQLVGALGVADVIAEQDHAVFEVSGLPCVQEIISGSERKHVAGVGSICLLAGMAV